ncbi:MAG: nitrile hydratase subunit beta [Pseudomonadota bacterium]
MIGPQDLGGRGGFGPVRPEENEPVFHAPWEGRALGLTLTAGALGHWTLDESRHARECLPPAFYLDASYYDIWLTALEALLERHGEVSAEERARGECHRPGLRPERRLKASDVAAVLRRGGPVDREPRHAARFQVGDKVITRHDRTPGHTRLPGYAMGKTGEIVAIRGCHVFPDAHAHGRGDEPEWLYAVAFTASELWGAGAENAQDDVMIDAFEPYLCHD